MLINLFNHIRCFIPVSTELEEHLAHICELKHVEKGSLLHSPGKICLHTYFINKGLTRLFYRHLDKEITDSFSSEGEWITSVHSFMSNIPDYFYIETLEVTEVVAIRNDHLENCFEKFPEMQKYGRMLISKYYVEQSERIISLQFHSSKERYDYFCRTSKNKAGRVPLHMIASHLGITQETLSRIRADS